MDEKDVVSLIEIQTYINEINCSVILKLTV